jgi:hypothetical protein
METVVTAALKALRHPKNGLSARLKAVPWLGD